MGGLSRSDCSGINDLYNNNYRGPEKVLVLDNSPNDYLGAITGKFYSIYGNDRRHPGF